MTMPNFVGLTFDEFRNRARDMSLTPNERIGFPESYRGGKDQAIFNDILTKLPRLASTNRLVIDIGSGCGDLTRLLIEHCAYRDHFLVLVDSEEMLRAHCPPLRGEMAPHRFPQDASFLSRYQGGADVVTVYSVIHHEFLSGNVWAFVDALSSLLAPGGMALIGDVPNRSMRRRFLKSESGQAFHRAFTRSETNPPIPPDDIAPGEIDDSVVVSLLMRVRGQGIHAYVLPQVEELPFANRREDIILHRP